MTNQLDCADGPSLPNTGEGARIDGCRLLTIPGQEDQVQAYRLVADLLEGDAHQYWYMIGWMCLTLFVLRAFSIYLFKTVSHIDR
jgi:hypothetical protein